MNTSDEFSSTTVPEINERDRIITSYREHVLEHGQEPPSIHSFCKDIGIEEQEFYEYFNNFDQVADAFWTQLFEEVRNAVEAGEDYSQFSTRDKLLTFYYGYFERLREHRSYFIISFEAGFFGLSPQSGNLTQLKRSYKDWIGVLVMEGIHREEISSRSRLTETYASLFWYQFMFLLNFWKRDRSRGFEKTDAAIEKAVNLSFDLIEKNALDSAFDFGKFMFQNR